MIEELTLVSYQLMPKRSFVLTGTDLDNTTTVLTDQYDAAGIFIGHDNTTDDTITGVWTTVQRNVLNDQSEAINADASFKLSSLRDLTMPTSDSNDQRYKWVITDSENNRFKLVSKTRKGKVYQYAAELLSNAN